MLYLVLSHKGNCWYLCVWPEITSHWHRLVHLSAEWLLLLGREENGDSHSKLVLVAVVVDTLHWILIFVPI